MLVRALGGILLARRWSSPRAAGRRPARRTRRIGRSGRGRVRSRTGAGHDRRPGRAGDRDSAGADPPPTTLKVAGSSFGRTIADRHGEALYLFDADPKDVSTCYGACAEAWPPLLAKRKPTVRSPLDPALVGTTKRRDGTRQVTYNGHPLYYYVGDEPGLIRCQNVAEYGGQWLIVKPNGRANLAR